jgi:hypothetical protein
VVSSPYGQSGALWDLHRKHYGRDDSPTLVWQASAPEMNPTLPADYLQRMEVEDPEAYRSEVLGEFRAGLSTLLDPDALDACVAHGRALELPPRRGVTYRAFIDPSGGRRDAFACAVGHRVGDLAVVDALRAWEAPFNPSGVVAEIASLLRSYRVSKVFSDRYAGQWPKEAFGLQRVRLEPAAKSASDLFLDFVAHANSARVELPNDPKLVRELRSLERRRGSSGKDRVSHPATGFDYRAVAVAGLSGLLLGKRPSRTPEEEGIPDLFEFVMFGRGGVRFPDSWDAAWGVEGDNRFNWDMPCDLRHRRVPPPPGHPEEEAWQAFQGRESNEET